MNIDLVVFAPIFLFCLGLLGLIPPYGEPQDGKAPILLSHRLVWMGFFFGMAVLLVILNGWLGWSPLA